MALLDRIKKEAPAQPSRVYLYAAEKWGKTSFAAFAPKPIFLMTQGETGLLDLISWGRVPPTDHFPDDFKTWPDLMDAVAQVANDPHDFQTLVIDTANGAERLLTDYILQQDFNGRMSGKGGYNDYGKGDLACIPLWSQFLRELDNVRIRRRMSIILLAHSQIKTVNNPEGDDYDQFRPEGVNKLWPLTHKWASVIAAGNWRLVVKDDKLAATGDRILRTKGTSAAVCGNRYGLPDQIACGSTPQQAWNAFASAMRAARPKSPSSTGAKTETPAQEPAKPTEQPPATSPEPVETQPADEQPKVEPAATDRPNPYSSADEIQQLLTACHKLDMSFSQALKQHQAELNFTGDADLTHASELEPGQRQLLGELLQKKIAAKRTRKSSKPEPATV